MIFILSSILQDEPTISITVAPLYLELFGYVTIPPLIPRFIISIRELYDRDVRGRWQGVDAGFGITSQPGGSEVAVVSAIAFADAIPGRDEAVARDGDSDGAEAIQLEVVEDGERSV